MLVLTRRIDECLMIGDDVKVMIVDIKHNQVRIGIRAPRQIEVHREEIYQLIQQQNAEKSCR